ncbi:hypothetical protein J5N97_022395 [Dioscorea zingiberensis]|uniref:Uncharacterized protein n=1 Tax=Dioscorea zingiberensis TaxID=325984 RepID=A0A9D5CB44_9LILI|nr:hypothetical protein J5N97_022395 [Dioscorea zingiberensis]
MGGFCSKRSAVDKSPSDSTLNVNGLRDHESMNYESNMKIKSRVMNPPEVETMEKRFSDQSFSFSAQIMPGHENTPTGVAAEAREPQLSRSLSQKSKPTKVSEVSSLLGKAGTLGLGKAVEVLDTLGSSVTSLSPSSGFGSGTSNKGNKIAILAFEVANTIVKGANLMQSLSKKNIKHLKEVVLPSEGVQHLVSKDMDELLRIAAGDKREELKVFAGEIVRFGNRCKDPQWHNLGRYFDKLGSELTPQKQLKEEAPNMMQQLMTLVQYTAELYHESHTLDRFQQDYRRKRQEDENPNAGDNLQLLRQELKSQKKNVKNLKKKSLWSKNLEEVMEKLVDIVHFLHLEIRDAFGIADGDKPVKGSFNTHQRLGSAGLALHYANIITQIDTLVSRSSSVPPNSRDTLYQCLPPSIKGALRNKVIAFQAKEELTIPLIKAEMEKTLRWLVPIANNTTKAHHGFGWVGEWANTGIEANQNLTGQTDLIRIETLHHADKGRTEAYILDLVVWLHHLVSLSRSASGGFRSPIKSPVRSPSQKSLTLSFPVNNNKPTTQSSALTLEDKEMLRDVKFRKLTPGISKSQEFDSSKTTYENSRLTKSSSHSPTSESNKEFVPVRRPSMPPVIDFDIDRIKALDAIDRVDTLRRQ